VRTLTERLASAQKLYLVGWCTSKPVLKAAGVSARNDIRGSEGFLRGRFNWAPSGGLNGGFTVGFDR
jgi:hypothetical protein